MITIDVIDLHAATDGGEADGERDLSHSVARQECLATETGWRQRLRESIEPLFVDHLGAHAGNAPGGKIERLGVLGADAARSERVTERRAEGNRRAVLRH